MQQIINDTIHLARPVAHQLSSFYILQVWKGHREPDSKSDTIPGAEVRVLYAATIKKKPLAPVGLYISLITVSAKFAV